jgi:hypothetical protein
MNRMKYTVAFLTAALGATYASSVSAAKFDSCRSKCAQDLEICLPEPNSNDPNAAKQDEVCIKAFKACMKKCPPSQTRPKKKGG